MEQQLPRRVTVLIDNQEKTPFEFPDSIQYWPWSTGVPTRILIDKERMHLPTGDYALRGYEHKCLIERKADQRELAKNLLSDDRRRFLDCLDRLANECEFPYVVIEGSVSSFMTESQILNIPHPEKLTDTLLRSTGNRGVPIMFLGSANSPHTRMRQGAFLLHLMLNHALDASGPGEHHEYESTPEQHTVFQDDTLEPAQDGSGQAGET